MIRKVHILLTILCLIAVFMTIQDICSLANATDEERNGRLALKRLAPTTETEQPTTETEQPTTETKQPTTETEQPTTETEQPTTETEQPTIKTEQPTTGFWQSAADWESDSGAVRQFWLDALGQPVNYEFAPTVEQIDSFQTPEFDARILTQQNSPTTRQTMALLTPKNLPARRAPGFVVPFYDPDRMCGYSLATKKRLPPGREYAEFGRLLVQAGYVVLCVQTYPYNLLDDPDATAQSQGLNWWAQAAAKLNAQQPTWTGMGKLVADARLALDYLASLEYVDPNRLAMAGHSLGGKVAFYVGCLDKRVKLIWASDFGIRWSDTNWQDRWYWGPEKVKAFRDRQIDHALLLAVHAPGVFLLIAGEADGAKSEPLLERARRVYQLYGPEPHVFMFNHASGHQPTRSTVEQSLVQIARWAQEGKRKP